jgi:hypothetical protein
VPELLVDTLALRISNAEGHAHRIEPILQRAFDLLGTRLGELDGPARPSQPATDQAPPGIDLANQTDDEAAAVVAGAWLHALTLRLEG